MKLVMLHCFNLRTYKQSYTPTVVREGRDGAPPLGFCCALIFRRELAFGTLDDEVYSEGCGAAGDL